MRTATCAAELVLRIVCFVYTLWGWTPKQINVCCLNFLNQAKPTTEVPVGWDVDCIKNVARCLLDKDLQYPQIKPTFRENLLSSSPEYIGLFIVIVVAARPSATSLIYINNCPTRCNKKQSIYYSAISLYMFRVSTTPIIRITQNFNYSVRYCAASSLQRGYVGGR